MSDNKERALQAAKHLVSTSSLSGLIDCDRLFEEVERESFFTEPEPFQLFCVLKTILGMYSPIYLFEVIWELSDENRQATLEALNLAFSTKEEWQ